MLMRKMMRYSRDVGVDDVLKMVGLARRRGAAMWMMPAFGFLLLGAAVGAGIGMMLAPSSGRVVRQQVEGRIAQVRDRLRQRRMSDANAVSSNVTPEPGRN